MSPTLRPAQYIVATRWYWHLAPENIIIIKHNGLEKIKRIEKITDQHVFVVGDNIRQSVDSRSFGWLPLSSIIGKVIWPRI